MKPRQQQLTAALVYGVSVIRYFYKGRWPLGWLVAVTIASGCLPGKARNPLGDIAPCWQQGSPHRQAGQHIMPFVEPLAPTGYLSDGVFEVAGFCEKGENGNARSAREVLACERDACLRPLEVNTTRERRTEPWPKDEVESCLHDLAVDTRPRYDALNAAFEEPNLIGRGESFVAYRLYVFETGSFAHRMVRLVKTQAGAYAVVKGLEATEVPGQGRLSWRLVRGVTDKEWRKLEELLAKANYWALPPRLRSEVVLFDGKFYELEGVRGERQHLVISPVVEGSLGKLVDYLVTFSDCANSQ